MDRARTFSRSALVVTLATLVAGGLAAGTAAASAPTEPRVINGEPVVGVYPWMAFVALRSGPSGPYQRHCGGTLISPRWVLTAGHCAAGLAPGRFRLFIGRMDIDDTDGEIRFIDRIVVHPRYDASSNRFDVAVMHLTRASGKAPLRMAGTEHLALWDDPGDTARVLGWGRREDGTSPDRLHRAEVEMVPDAQCGIFYPELHRPTMVCAGGTDTDTCQGDSGGPMLVRTAAGLRQIGVTSFGIGCGDGFPGVYAQVGTDPLRSWIEARSG